ncbi:MAG: type II secretion system GspH family protein [Campylobacter sp.]|uniref:type II secretion system protein n=1 Tax=Campylobacter sp. TaxID=205 RepID=UPI002AA880B4|nr:type II secretion system protein [Campylobacter sp.]MCI6177648.1 type II secretion system GspH family protein [Campylobacter sp.]
MKKGFTMIELIFVIVILGILASVAIPRLAATREDAEISAAVANLRTLVSDASAYYVAKGSFNGVKWKDITGVPLTKNGGLPITTELATVEGSLYIGGTRCIGVALADKVGKIPARIVFTTTNSNISNVCEQVLATDSVKAYLDSTVASLPKTMAIGSSTSVY